MSFQGPSRYDWEGDLEIRQDLQNVHPLVYNKILLLLS